MKKLLKGGIATIVTAGAVVSANVNAAVPADVTTALTDATSDVSTIGWAVFAVLIAAAAFKYMRRAL